MILNYLLNLKAKQKLNLFLVIIFSLLILKLSNNDRSKGHICPPVGTVINSFYGHCNENFQKLNILKNSLKDPSSFEVVSTEQLEGNKLKVVYRATNGFGAIVTESKTLY